MSDATTRFFNGKVEEWQRRYATPDDYWYRRNVLSAGWLTRWLPPRARCLEIGCAAGQLSELLHDRGHDVYGADVSSAMIDTARGRMSQRSVPEDHFRLCDIESLPFPDEMFDLAVGLDLLPYIENQPRYLGEVGRVLKRGGLALFNNVNPRALYVKIAVIRVLLPPQLGWSSHIRNLLQTGYWSGGFVDLSKAVQARSAESLDAFFADAGFGMVGGYDMYNLNSLDRRPLGRSRLGTRLARRWGWNHFGLYVKSNGS